MDENGSFFLPLCFAAFLLGRAKALFLVSVSRYTLALFLFLVLPLLSRDELGLPLAPLATTVFDTNN